MTTDLDHARARLEAATYEASNDSRRIDANRVKELTLQGLSISEIADTLGCGKSAVSQARKRMGVNKPRNSHRKVDIDQLRELAGQGLSRQELAEHFDCTPERITAARKLADLPPQSRGSGRHKVINREEVRARTEQGQTLEQIANALGFSIRGIAHVRAELGITQPNTLTPDRVQRIEAMLADQCSHAEIVRTVHTSQQTLKRRYPGTAWTPEQRNEYTRTLRLEHGINWGHQRPDLITKKAS